MIVFEKHFLLCAFTDGEHFMAPNYSLVSLTAEDVQRYMNTHDIVLELREKLTGCNIGTPDFNFLACWDSRASFFSKPSCCKADRMQALLRHADDQECVRLSGETALFIDSLCEDTDSFAEGGYQRMDYVYANFDEEGIYWEGCVMHGDYRVSTAKLPWEYISVDGELTLEQAKEAC